MSDPSTSSAIKEVAARSLVERLREKTNLVRFFRYNAAAKHGVPIDYETESSLSVGIKAESPVTQPTTAAKIGLGKGVAIGLLSAAGLLGAGVGGYMLAKPKQPATVQKQLPYESPLQWLEDEGKHLPPEETAK